MKISFSSQSIAGILMFCLMAASKAQELDTPWRLRVMDMNHQVKVEAIIRFKDEIAKSCMGGTWKRIVVEEKTMEAEDFFPLDGPLAYEPGSELLRFGRAQVCDGYLFLTGKKQSPTTEGNYDAISWGAGKRLGYFSLQKAQ
jgi:hypothetical protein